MRDYVINSELIKEWNWEKNNELGLHPDELTLGSGKKAWWICDLGHEWFAAICSRSEGRGCPYCSNRMIMIGFNDLLTTHGDLCREWDYDKNDILPTQVSAGSSKKVWWTCDLGHSYLMSIDSRVCSGNGCPYCSGRKILIGFNDLNTVNPKLSREWNYKKNGDLTPEMVTVSSAKVVWWQCEKGHEWQRRIADRNCGCGCPYCCGYYVQSGQNDLATTRPDLVLEWNYKKNGDLLPTQISRGYGHKVWWKCKNGHEWQATPNSRDNMDSGCPACSKGNRISIQETIIYFYIKKYFGDAKQCYRDKNLGITEIDVFIPSLRIGIEYDGFYWHQDVENDKQKDVACQNNDITLIRVRDVGCPIYKSSCEFILLDNRSISELCKVCERLLCKFGIKNPLIDIQNDIDRIKKIRDESLCQNNTK